jgi:ethanolamine utilization protein EutA (predicted chaperonin)
MESNVIYQNTCLSLGARLCKLQKGCTRLAAASDKVYQLLAHARWFSPASSTTKTGRHDIAEILLKVALKHQKSNHVYVYLEVINYSFSPVF